jgi:hypothetical protein
MELQIKAIPLPTLTEKQRQMMAEKNREKDKENFDHTIKILEDRLVEAVQDGDQKKKYAAIAVEKDQRDRYNVRSRIQELRLQFNNLKKAIPQDDWEILKPLLDVADESFWEKGRTEGCFDEKELHKCLRDEFEVQPKFIVKLIELMKLNQEIQKFEAINK